MYGLGDICTDSDKGTGTYAQIRTKGQGTHAQRDICTTAIFPEKSSISDNWGFKKESNLFKNLQPSNGHTFALGIINIGKFVSEKNLDNKQIGFVKL